MLKDVIGAVLEAGRKSDAQSQAMAAGKANIVDVVTAVSETEVAVEALVVGARPGDRGLRRNHADADLIRLANPASPALACKESEQSNAEQS